MKVIKLDRKKIKDYILYQATEQDMIELIELMRSKKALLDLEKIAKEKEKIIDRIKKI
ncbi:hypothetical protein G8C15_17055 [Enterococcus casseliflavus]|nr:hypothetical protein [Enterococcus casseliflavus]MBF0014395.1 hypothetical protein [Enterococcus casseliflavus]